MRACKKPDINITYAYTECVNSISDDNHKNNLFTLLPSILASSSDYDQKSQVGGLYKIPAYPGSPETLVGNGVTKGQLTKLYTQQMVPKKKPARAIYNALIDLAPGGKCPFCGYSDVRTLDHFLPKAKFPFLTVTPINLVPSCWDCNTDKNADIATSAGKQMLHPYYDHKALVEDQWVFAKATHESPASISYYVDPPAHWPPVLKLRVASHFKDNNLAARYAVQAANQLATLRFSLAIYYKTGGVKSVQFHLNTQADAEKNQYINSWQSAMFEALANDIWFCDNGFS